jgi:DNA mismatch repair ATPase MutS
MNAIEFYQRKKEISQNKLSALKKKLALNSILRLVAFALVIVVLYSFFRNHPGLAIIGSVFFFIVFLALVRHNLNLQKQRNYFQAYYEIVCHEIEALNYDFRNFRNGERFINHKHAFSYDLDLFGQGSAFASLNRTVTVSGENLLAKLLLTDETESVKIIHAQDAIRELSAKSEFMLDFRATGKTSEIQDEEKEKIYEWCNTPSFYNGKNLLRILSYALPVLILSSVIYVIINPAAFSLIVFLYLINLGVVGINLKQINKEHERVSSFLKILNKYKDLLEVIENESVESELLKDGIQKLHVTGKTAGATLNSFTKLVGAFDSRLNMFAAMFLEGFLLFDYHCLFALEKWRSKFGQHLPAWLDVVAHYDAKVSVATYAFNQSDTIYPAISDSVMLHSNLLGHPLIPSQTRVCNDFSIISQGNFVIITGANMAGKSTFLRTVGLNLVFAKAGLPVCAAFFEFKPLKLFTSMRTSDSLAENESYFYAELRRLKDILTKLEKGEELFIILDEILKGTNSVDKQKGSYMALEKILHLNGSGLIATHDLALTGIAEKYPQKIKNQCFEIEIDNAKISFDYKLYDGVTRKMNAMLLMEHMGII